MGTFPKAVATYTKMSVFQGSTSRLQVYHVLTSFLLALEAKMKNEIFCFLQVTLQE